MNLPRTGSCVMLVLAATLLLCSSVTWALTCAPCNSANCPAITAENCPGGVVLDECETNYNFDTNATCCNTCAKLAGEACGGAQGKCGVGLQCSMDATSGTTGTTPAGIGICVEVAVPAPDPTAATTQASQATDCSAMTAKWQEQFNNWEASVKKWEAAFQSWEEKKNQC